MNNENVYSIVKKIPSGQVASYGQIAALAGFPRHARQVGRALRALKNNNPKQIPWHRVVNAQGFISERGIDGSEAIQRILLEAEGIKFSAQGRISLNEFGWQAVLTNISSKTA